MTFRSVWTTLRVPWVILRIITSRSLRVVSWSCHCQMKWLRKFTYRPQGMKYCSVKFLILIMSISYVCSLDKIVLQSFRGRFCMDAFDPKKYHYRTCREGHCRTQSHATKAGKRATCEGGGHCVLLNVSVYRISMDIKCQYLFWVLMLAFFAKVATMLASSDNLFSSLWLFLIVYSHSLVVQPERAQLFSIFALCQR